MTFKDLALPLTARGIAVIPVNPLAKDCYLPGGEERGTLDTARIEQWNQENAAYNVGCLGTQNGVTVLDCDVPGLMTRIEAETGQKCPETFTVKSAGKGCAHFYFRQTDASRRLGNKKGDGLFDLRGANHYVVGPGSKLRRDDGTIAEYKIWRDATIADFPDWLEKWILDNSSSKKGAPTGDVDQDSYRRLRRAYQANLDPADMLGLPDLTISSLHPTLHSLACLLHDGRRTEDDVAEVLEKIADNYGHRQARGRQEIDGLVEHAFKKEPCEFTLDEGHPALEAFTDGLRVFATEEELKEHLKERLYAAYVAPVTEEESDETKMMIYPRVWGGTLYDEFAETSRKGNNIPYEFLVESMKTVMGAVVGSNLTAQGEYGAIEGAIPRFYTVMITDGQGGKGTSIKYALNAFKVRDSKGLVISQSPIWPGEADPSENRWVGSGVAQTTFNSIPGLGRIKNQPRVLQAYGELSQLMNSVGNEVAGEGLLAVIRDLYDGTSYEVGATAKRAPLSGDVEHSLLSGTTPDIWRSMFSKKQVEGTGLFQRFNLVPVEKTEHSTLYAPNLTSVHGQIISMLEGMVAEPIVIHFSKSSIAMLDEWFRPFTANPDLKADDYGRLNVLAMRNCLHLALMRGKREVGVDEMGAAMKLSDYQFAARARYKPASGFNDWALVEDEVRLAVLAARKVKLRDLTRGRLKKYGMKMVKMAAQALADDGRITLTEMTPQHGGTKTVWLTWRAD